MNHQWDRDRQRHLFARQVPDGIERIERTCGRCGAVKITLMPAGDEPWSEWRLADGSVWRGPSKPKCAARKSAQLKEADA